MPIGWDGSTRHSELIRRAFGQDEIVPPGVTLEIDRPEWSVLKQEELFSQIAPLVAAGGAAAMSKVQFVCPPGKFAIFKLILHGKAAGAFACAVRLIASVTTGAWTFFDRVKARDTRLRTPTQTLAMEVWVENTTGVAGTQLAVFQPGDHFDQPIVIAPGFSLLLDPNALNTQIDSVSVHGYLRPFEREEATA
jgi:hypothetical protein